MIVVGGENLIDFVQTSTTDGLPVYTAFPGGSCYNVAMAAARQSAAVSYVTPISTDSLGKVLRDRLEASGVERFGPASDLPTSLAVVTVNESIPSYQFYRTQTAERDVTEEKIWTACPDDYDIFHVGSLALIDGADADVWAKCMATARAQGKVTSLDPNARPVMVKDPQAYRARLLDASKHAVVLKLSDEDLEYVCPDMSQTEAFDFLATHSDASLVVLTRGAEGALGRIRAGEVTVPVHAADPLVDTVGAGDTFMATLLSELSRRGCVSSGDIDALSLDGLRSLLDTAAVAAALNCERSGCNPPSLAEIRSAIT